MLTDLHPADLADVLRASARTPAESAGVEMLALHGEFLTRPDFIRTGLRGDRDTGAVHVSWRNLGQYTLGSAPGHAVVQMACSLAGETTSPAVGRSWTIGALLTSLAGDPAARSATAVAVLGLAEGRWDL